MSSKLDYYAILGIPRNSSESDIKKAYYKLALRWHPDKNRENQVEAEKKFKEISEAYEVLSDKQKRVTYDRYGKEGLRNGTASFNHDPFRGHFHRFAFRDPFDVFREFLEEETLFADFFFKPDFAFGHSTPDLSGFRSPFDAFSLQPPMHGFARGHRIRQHPQQPSADRVYSTTSMIGFSPFFNDPFFGAIGFTSMGGSGFPRSVNMKSISTSTTVVNGRRIITKKVVENGIETVTVEENGVVKSITVNGEPQSIVVKS